MSPLLSLLIDWHGFVIIDSIVFGILALVQLGIFG